MPYAPYSPRTLGLWLLYALGGLIIAVMLLGGDGGWGGDSRSPTRARTKVLAGVGGALLAIAALGLYLLGDPLAAPAWPRVMLWGGGPVGLVASVWSWGWIARDLNGGR